MHTSNRNHSIVSIAVVAALVSIGIAVGMVIAPVKAQSTFASIGYVDVSQALEAHPDLETVRAQISQFQDAKLQELSEYEGRSNLTDEERSNLMEALNRIQDEVDQEQTRLTQPLIQDIVDATSEVGEESGIEVILEAGSVMWGGLNLTPLVLAKIQAQ
jgi:outer membrane protein